MTPASIVVTVNHAHLARVMAARRRAGLPAASVAPALATALPPQHDDEAVVLPTRNEVACG